MGFLPHDSYADSVATLADWNWMQEESDRFSVLARNLIHSVSENVEPYDPAERREPFPRDSTLCLNGQIEDQSRYLLVSGGSADIWTGSFKGQTVAIKVMRGFSSIGTPIEKEKLLKRLWREYLAWYSLSHPNILQCLGFSHDFTPNPGSECEVPSLISPWMTNGTVLPYIQKQPDPDRLELLVEVASGLSYLHTRDPPIVHGDIRSGNILISDAGVACLTDFGLSRILSDVRGMTTSSEVAGSLRWMAPELFRDEKPGIKSDVWAYGMTVLEILTAARPYSELKAEVAVLTRIMDGHIPSRPFHDGVSPAFTDHVWDVCQQCWYINPTRRLSICEAKAELRDEQNRQFSHQWCNSWRQGLGKCFEEAAALMAAYANGPTSELTSAVRGISSNVDP